MKHPFSLIWKFLKKIISFLSDETGPPPLPPHGITSNTVDNVDYRPPVPPHRNIGVTANINNTGSGSNRVSHKNFNVSVIKHVP